MRLTARIRKVGTSKGIIIPYYILKTLGIDLDDQVNIEITTAKSNPREGWRDAFERYAYDYDMNEDDLSGSTTFEVEYRIDEADKVDIAKSIRITVAKPFTGNMIDYAKCIITDKEKVNKSRVHINDIIIL